MPLEVERKYLNVDFAALRRALCDLDARNLGAHFESNWVFDTPDARLFANGRLLRLRMQEWPDAQTARGAKRAVQGARGT